MQTFLIVFSVALCLALLIMYIRLSVYLDGLEKRITEVEETLKEKPKRRPNSGNAAKKNDGKKEGAK